MSLPQRDPGSFRDPSGHVYEIGGRILRTVNGAAADHFRQARESGLLADLVSQGYLLSATELDPATQTIPGAPPPALLLEHPRLPIVSYPYEWSFAAHRAAALLHLDLHLAALDRGFTLSDASAYNVQFIGTRPIFIDHLSLRPYRAGEIWAGHRQFCMQFLNPLLLQAKLGISPQAWFRGQLEGIDPVDLARILPWHQRLSLTVLSHVFLQARLQQRMVARDGKVNARLRAASLPKASFRAMLRGLRDYIAGLRLAGDRTTWSDYVGKTSYSDSETETKRRFVAMMVRAVCPSTLIDLGCNTGDYSVLALESGAAQVIGFDFDLGALDLAFQRASKDDLPLTPLWLDAANPSPDQGWAQRERKGFASRAKADGLLALALLHHLVIGRNIPMDQALDWLIAMAPQGVIEFVPKSDPMVQRLLTLREDIFPDYDEATFRALVARRAHIERAEPVAEGGRLLLWYRRDPQAAGSGA